MTNFLLWEPEKNSFAKGETYFWDKMCQLRCNFARSSLLKVQLEQQQRNKQSKSGLHFFFSKTC